MHTHSAYTYKSIEIYLYRRKHISRLAPKQEKKEEKMEITHTHKAANYAFNREDEPPHKSSHDTIHIICFENHSASITR